MPHRSMKCYTYEQQYEKKNETVLLLFKKELLLTIVTQPDKSSLESMAAFAFIARDFVPDITYQYT